MRVVILDDYQDIVRRLDAFKKAAGHDVKIFNDTVKGVDALAARLADAEAIGCIRERTPISAALIERLPKLRMISQTGKNAPHIDLEACTRRGIVVSGGGGGAAGTPELTWALILMATRHLPFEINALKAGRWQSTIGHAVRGKTLGIFGYGKIGSDVAKVGRAFGMNVIAWGREGSQERATKDGFELAKSKADLFERADVLSVHLILRDSTRGVVGAEDLARMKPTSLFVNTSRAGLVAPDALVNALRAGRPGYAAVDVYEDEPVLGADHPLLKMANVICTPHLGYVEMGGYESFFNAVFDQINAFAAGAPINVMNPEVLKK